MYMQHTWRRESNSFRTVCLLLVVVEECLRGQKNGRSSGHQKHVNSHLEHRFILCGFVASKHTCSECSFSSDNEKVMARHIRFAHQGGILRCPKDGCQYTTSWQSSIFRHLQNVHGEHLIPCSVDGCTHKVKRRRLLDAHFLDSHPDLVDGTRMKSVAHAL